MKSIIFLLSNIFILQLSIQAQSDGTISWWNPAENSISVIEGQAWSQKLFSEYDRLPSRAKGKVANDVWNNSRHSAGLMIRFRSNASSINIRYQVRDRENYGMNHMPATGKSGVDLYAIDSDGDELWCKGQRSFSDTITYAYNQLNPNDQYHQLGREYRLYLPLYNQVQWLEIGVSDSTYFEALPIRSAKPIVVYGTSIAHGACASRPGMAWTSVLSRSMDRPLINLGFSGSGRLEKPVIDLIAEIEAKIFILDCLPNLPVNAWEKNNINDGDEVKERIFKSVKILRSKHKFTPILLTEHAGYTEEYISNKRKSDFATVNQIQKETFQELKNEGIQNLYYLTKEEIGLSMDAMVDGTHPTDLGMYQYAQAYEKKLRNILKEPNGNVSTTQPCTQAREPNNYIWEKRHREILDLNKAEPPNTVILANSIIHFWGGQPSAKISREPETWTDILMPAGVRNQAYGWDRIENVLWRIYHGELAGFEAARIVLMIGTNNLHLNSNREIIQGLDMLIEAIKIRQPKAQINIAGLLPRRNYEDRILQLNFEIARLAGEHSIEYADLGNELLLDNLSINESLFSDGLHPNKAGYLMLRCGMTKLCRSTK
ncbi:MAG: lysophospholipase L1-like esterase [Saprospiraceae bacterium]|jgi:lysophospholipase L1-like esterase